MQREPDGLEEPHEQYALPSITGPVVVLAML